MTTYTTVADLNGTTDDAQPATHTPGPWTAEPDAEDDGFWQVWHDEGGTGFAVACGIGSKANAHLIAAAPEMLALLRELVDIEGPCPGTAGWAENVHAAIARAEARE